MSGICLTGKTPDKAKTPTSMPTDSKDGIVAEAAGAVEFGLRPLRPFSRRTDVFLETGHARKTSTAIEESSGNVSEVLGPSASESSVTKEATNGTSHEEVVARRSSVETGHADTTSRRPPMVLQHVLMLGTQDTQAPGKYSGDAAAESRFAVHNSASNHLSELWRVISIIQIAQLSSLTSYTFRCAFLDNLPVFYIDQSRPNLGRVAVGMPDVDGLDIAVSLRHFEKLSVTWGEAARAAVERNCSPILKAMLGYQKNNFAQVDSPDQTVMRGVDPREIQDVEKAVEAKSTQKPTSRNVVEGSQVDESAIHEGEASATNKQHEEADNSLASHPAAGILPVFGGSSVPQKFVYATSKPTADLGETQSWRLPGSSSNLIAMSGLTSTAFPESRIGERWDKLLWTRDEVEDLLEFFPHYRGSLETTSDDNKNSGTEKDVNHHESEKMVSRSSRLRYAEKDFCWEDLEVAFCLLPGFFHHQSFIENVKSAVFNRKTGPRSQMPGCAERHRLLLHSIAMDFVALSPTNEWGQNHHRLGHWGKRESPKQNPRTDWMRKYIDDPSPVHSDNQHYIHLSITHLYPHHRPSPNPPPITQVNHQTIHNLHLILGMTIKRKFVEVVQAGGYDGHDSHSTDAMDHDDEDTTPRATEPTPRRSTSSIPQKTISLPHERTFGCHMMTQTYSHVVDYIKLTNPVTGNIPEVGGDAVLATFQSPQDMLLACFEGLTISPGANQAMKTTDVNVATWPTTIPVKWFRNRRNEMESD
ncbi:hypothetical protein FPV67DRAFT_1460879 [Lyophyllum atratum]|nr:hypothetical protein FPV67DRAFT_1460879 [Lyophyllum atratum]